MNPLAKYTNKEKVEIMVKVSAVHINPKHNATKTLRHNDRTDNRAKTIHKELTDKNECTATAEQVREQIDKFYKQAEKNFANYCTEKNGLSKSGKPKGMQNFTPKENAVKEMIFEISPDTTMEQCKELSQRIAELTGFTPLQIAIHRDEGHKNEKGEVEIHHHAHAVFFSLDQENGLQLARQQASLTKQNLGRMQDMASEVFKMERGERRLEKGEKSLQIKDYKLYAQMKEADRKQNKALQEQKEKDLREIQAEKEKSLRELENERLAQEQKLMEQMELIQQQMQQLNNLKVEQEQKEKDLIAREKDLQAQIQKIQDGQQGVFNDINLRAIEKKRGIGNLMKNICTFGAYFKDIDKQREREKEMATAISKDAINNASYELVKVKKELQAEQEKSKDYYARGSKIQKQKNELEQQLQQQAQTTKSLYDKVYRYEKLLKESSSDEWLQENTPNLYREKQQEREKLEKQSRKTYGRSY